MPEECGPQHALVGANIIVMMATVSTIVEIEKAIRQLPAEQWRELRRWMDEHPPQSHIQNWPVPPPDVPKEELRRIHALIEAEFSQVEAEPG
jgi:hypothetical protein